MSIFHRDDDVVIHLNPGRQAVLGMHARSHHPLRGMLSADGRLYVWIGDTMTHANLYEDHEVDADCLRLDITLDEVSVSLAGGALELLCDDDQVRELFARHGLQGDLDDHAALARVCDARRRGFRASSRSRGPSRAAGSSWTSIQGERTD